MIFLLKVTQNFSPKFQILTYVMSGLLKSLIHLFMQSQVVQIKEIRTFGVGFYKYKFFES